MGVATVSPGVAPADLGADVADRGGGGGRRYGHGGVQPRAGSDRSRVRDGQRVLHVQRTGAGALAGQARGGRGMVWCDRCDRPSVGIGPGLDRDGRLPDPGPAGALRRTDAGPARRTLPGDRRRDRRDRPRGRDVRPRHRHRVLPRRSGPGCRRPCREPERSRRRVRAPGAVPRRVVGRRVDVRRRLPGTGRVVPSARRYGTHHLHDGGPSRRTCWPP